MKARKEAMVLPQDTKLGAPAIHKPVGSPGLEKWGVWAWALRPPPWCRSDMIRVDNKQWPPTQGSALLQRNYSESGHDSIQGKKITTNNYIATLVANSLPGCVNAWLADHVHVSFWLKLCGSHAGTIYFTICHLHVHRGTHDYRPSLHIL